MEDGFAKVIRMTSTDYAKVRTVGIGVSCIRCDISPFSFYPFLFKDSVLDVSIFESLFIILILIHSL